VSFRSYDADIKSFESIEYNLNKTPSSATESLPVSGLFIWQHIDCKSRCLEGLESRTAGAAGMLIYAESKESMCHLTQCAM
jgi:hypothetical protein